MGVRKISLVAMMVALIMVLTGCIQMEVGVELNKDGSGGMEILMAQNTDLLEEELDPEAEAETDSLTFFQDEDFEGMEGVTTTTEAVEYMDKGYNFAGEKAIIEIEDMESFIAQMNEKEGEIGLRLVDLDNGNKRFEMTVELGDETLDGQETTQDDAQVWAMLEATGMKILYSITTDYEVVSHNAHIVDGDKYSLDLLRLSRELENTDQDSMIFFVEIETETTTEPEEEVEQDDEESKGSREEVENRLKAAIQLDRNHQDFYGEALKELGILKGTEKGLELNKGLTRAEGAVMYSRLLGLEEEIELFASENPDYTTDFTDVPDWVKPTINYLHSKGYVNGISTTEYGSGNFMKETEYATLVLRALGYKDGEDFEWNTANVRAEELGLFAKDAVQPSVMLGGEFNRRKMAYISYNALFSVDADGIELIERLEEE
ncbi:MAG TPA: hypothetical protein DHM42_06800 [Clostridiales bacterium]|nr:hypothetical protein [Clostridiales bacterium]